jgi:hypothetical protein
VLVQQRATAAMPRSKVPCGYLRKILVPALHDTSRIAELTAEQVASKWMHPAVLECSSDPLFWKPDEWAELTVGELTKRLLVAICKHSHSRVKVVGKALVIQLKLWQLLQGTGWVLPATEVVKPAEAADGQAAEEPTAEAVALQQAEEWYASLQPEQQLELKAVALFQNPPVVDRGTGHTTRYMSTDWPSRTYQNLPRYVCPA